ncbi:transglutaminase family protein [Lonepinella koalarum]|uniref:Transglutaminase-like putative cysteine protease n=1 Tax=Lonepinella koalarum TaxID=53417 RepID=A0A4R1KYG9_9PAST|nr:transglutaminase family protein [Lonepinella koalarum]MDH2926460.1 transglutaminase [Lonepinella koalarum]TCK69603.1 transglutaminase-like putative cysteine protease [Lonepinella koalarum]TFJ89845.1 transglutaminase family protein [Lonepinella koalarum]TYG34119.1 transglutaminase family protein [Lonepinella koalarum]
MKLMVNHQTHYHYSQPACNSIQYIKMLPQSSAHQRVHYWDISIPGERCMKRDVFGNLWITATQRFSYSHLSIMSQGVVELQPHNMGIHQPDVPSYLFLQPTAMTQWDKNMIEFCQQYVKIGSLSELRCLAEQIFKKVAYSAETTTVQTSAQDAFYAGVGVCQDHAHLMIALCRALGLPARYVSGYLFDQNTPHLASHAWAEVWLSQQWHCFDISNQLFDPTSHIYVAIGRDYLDVAPVRGMREQGGVETMQSTVQVLAC